MNSSLRAGFAWSLFSFLSVTLLLSETFAQTVPPVPATTQAPALSGVSPQPDWPSPVDDQHPHFFLLANILEYRPDLGGPGNATDYRWDVEGWYGGDYNRIWFKSEGQQNTALKADYDVDSQLLYGRFFEQYYDFQVGGRLETQSYRGRNATRGWAVIGLQGLVPYHYEI